MSPEPTVAQVEAGAEALRHRLQGDKKLKPWAEIPNSTKRKWRDYAWIVLRAALKQEDQRDLRSLEDD